MKDLILLLEYLGATSVRTYIQSGNIVFETQDKEDIFGEKISQAIQQHYGFSPQILLLNREELNTAMQENPFPEAEANPKTLHLGFLAHAPENPRLDDLERLKSPTEAFVLKGKVFYLYAPEGVGRSKLAASSERLLGVPMTDRNWNTVCKIYELATAEVK
jgi:uncharacterized protein (DUF1697 family)